MHTGTLVAPLHQATKRGMPIVTVDRRRRLLHVLAGPANTTPVHRSPRTGRHERDRPRHSG
jgi:hypothetical protein